MKSTYLAIFLGVVILIMFGVLIFAPAPKKALVPEAPSATSNESVFTWMLVTEEERDGVPYMRVSLNGRDLGVYAGSCSQIATENLEENEVSGVLCWWAGGGTEIGVFKEGDGYVVKEGVQDEGTAETPGFRGNFKTLLFL